jgi:hypothetical protein
MSKKSLFEKLFEEVMQPGQEGDEAALGLPSAEEGMGEQGEMGEEGGSEDVTISMDRDTAQKLHDLLASVLGGDVEADEHMGEEGGEGEMGEEGEDDESWSEDAEEEKKEKEDEQEEMHESPQSEYVPFTNKGESLKGKNNKVPGIASNVSGAGKAAQTSQTPGTEKYMPAKTAYADGKSNQVSSNIKPSGAGKSVFQR